MRGIVKHFPGAKALDGVDLEVRAGEVHCLLGQNGAGKSTLIKVLSGAHQPDAGIIELDGQEVRIASPVRALALGVATMYQELDVVEGLSIAENVFLGHELASAGLTRRHDANRVAADFTVAGGESATANLLQSAPKIDAIWNHDDDQGVGVLAAIEAAGRDEFFMVGGAGSKNVMEHIQAGDTVLQATVVYPSTQAADGIRLARLVAHNKSMGDLVSHTVPREIQLFAPTVTKDNVADFIDDAFES